MGETLSEINHYLDFLFSYGSIWVYGAIFVACFIENLVPPFPGDSFILVGGGLVALGRLSIGPVLGVALVGGLCSVMLLYYLGRVHGRDFFIKKNYKFLSATDIYRMESLFSRRGGLILVFSRFVVGARSALALVAGMGRYSAVRTLSYSLISYLLFAGLLLYIGVTLAENIDAIGRIVKTYNIIVWPIVIGLALIWLWWRFMRSGRKNAV